MNVQLLQYYSIQGLCRALDIYNGHSNPRATTKILGYRFLLQHCNKEPRIAPNTESIIKKVNEMVDEYSKIESEESNSVMMDLVDILLEFSPKDGDALLKKLRESKIKASNRGPTEDGTKDTVYADSQSSHNEDINSSVKKAAKKLVKEYPEPIKKKEAIELKDSITNVLVDSVDDIDKKSMEEILERIWIDNATFGMDIMLKDVMIGLCQWIDKDENGIQLKTRLIEELLESHRYCSTGILGRLINVMQGFTDDEDYQIKIGVKEQCKSVIYTYINNQLQSCENPDVMDGMLDKSPIYLEFIKNSIENMLKKWKEEYGEDFYDLVKETVEDYVKCKLY